MCDAAYTCIAICNMYAVFYAPPIIIIISDSLANIVHINVLVIFNRIIARPIDTSVSLLKFTIISCRKL